MTSCEALNTNSMRSCPLRHAKPACRSRRHFQNGLEQVVGSGRRLKTCRGCSGWALARQQQRIARLADWRRADRSS
eukprot:7838211-Alexandrium_andersonii.AAC.1